MAILRNGTKLTFLAGVELVLRAISDSRKYHVSGGTQYIFGKCSNDANPVQILMDAVDKL